MKFKKIIPVIGMIILLLVSTSCGGDSGGGTGTFKAGKCLVTEFNSGDVTTGDGYALDYSGIKKGYVGIEATSNFDKMVFQVNVAGKQYNYWFDEENKTLIVPLQHGNDAYNFKVLKNTSGDRYVELYSETKSVQLRNEYQPFIRSNSMVNYKADSECVKEASNLASQVNDDLELVQKVYEYIKDEVDYDQEFADSNPDMYYPKLDDTLDSGMGICFDYAALAAGMLRSQGIPTKLITGYINLDGEVYHAWNMIYIKNKGWIVAKVEASAKKWNQVDITMDDTGDISSLGDDSYTQKNVY